MNALFSKIYWFIFEPFYRRVSRDTSLRLQELTRVQVEFEERWLVKVSDELVAMSLRFAPYIHEREVEFPERSTYDLIDIVGRMHSTGDLVELSEKLSIPLDELAHIYIKYGNVNRAGIARIVELEQQIKRLSNKDTSGTGTEAKSAISSPSKSHSRPTDRITVSADRDHSLGK